MALASTTTTTTASNFLVPNGTFIAELVLFIIVLGFIAAFVLPPIMKVMRERDETIRGHVFCSFLALVMRQALQSLLIERGHKFEWADVLQHLNRLQYCYYL